MAETNSGWQHSYLQSTFKQCVRRQFQHGKTVFGSPSVHVDLLSSKDTFQAGGALQVIQGDITTAVFGTPIEDPSGLGRWCGFTINGSGGQKWSIITGYRVCSSSIAASPLGSTFHREYVYFQEQGHQHPRPRNQFVDDLSSTLRSLREAGHALVVMMDANAVITKDRKLSDMLQSHDLVDLHHANPAPSTYIASEQRRIDYIFGCPRIVASMSRQGTLSYFEGPQSDHRALYIDVNISQLFGTTTRVDRLPGLQRRALRSGNPESTSTYITQIRQYYSDHRMKERIDDLFHTHRLLTRAQVRRLLIAWDDDQGRAMEHAEKVLRVQPKLYKWSPRLRNAGVLLRYWKLRLREITHAEDYSSTFARWERKIQQFDPSFELPQRKIELPIADVRKHFNQATRKLRATQRQATELHSSSYDELLDYYESDANPLTQPESKRKAAIVRRTKAGENSRQLFGKIRQIVKPGEYSALQQVLVPRHAESTNETEPGQVHNILKCNAPENIIWDTVITRQEIEEHLISFNREAFRAAAESPCGHGLIHDALSFTSLSAEAESLLEGEIPDEWHGDRELLREFLASFQIPGSVLDGDLISLTISADDIVKGFKSWKETTTTSPSGRHLGHYKALIQDPILLESFRKFLNIAISRGIAIPRWCKAVNVMIEKDSGSPKINRLRIIHLFEADYNLFLKIMWGSRLVRQAVRLRLLNDGQHGSVPGRTTMDPVMLNQLTTDLCRVLKVNYARFDNDASACFDRIIVALGMLAARRCGMPTEAVRTHAKSLEFMQYMVKTIYGISEQSYRGTPLEPLFGTGQGSGASPAVWLTLVVVLLNTLERVVPDRISFRSVDGKITHRRLVDAFVDDTAIGITDNGSKTLPELVQALETAAQTWEQLLHFSGGALNLKKCSWYALYWDWRQGRPHIRTISDHDPQINLYQGSTDNAHTIEIRRQGITESARILGVHQSPTGDFSTHLQVMKAKADKYAGYIRSPRLSPSDIRVFHRTIYAPAMRYSLPAIAVDEEEFAQVQAKILPTIVQKLGLTSKLPTAIRHGPTSMGGLGLLDLRTEGGIEMLKYFRHEVYGNTEVGKLFLLQLQASQLESGLSIPLLEEPGIFLPYLTPTWILSMRQFMSNHNIKITLTDTISFPLKSPTDQYVMDVERLQGYSHNQQKDINLIRIYLQITTIAEMTDSEIPTNIARWALQGERPDDFVPKDAWPRQLPPSSLQKRLWRRYISSQFLRYDRKWRTNPLGHTPVNEPLAHSRPSTHQAGPVALRLKGLPRNQKRMMTHIHFAASDAQLWRECQRKQTLTIASDGGLKGRHGTFGWSLTTPQNNILCEGAGPVDGPFDTANSTRCELGGYAAALILISILQRSWGKRHKCQFRWITDSKSAITNVANYTSHRQIKARQPSNPDYMSIIQHETKFIRRKISRVWVKGHQTVQSHPAESTSKKDAVRNSHVDHLATWYRECSKKRQSVEKTEHTPEAKITLSINGVRLVSQIESCLRFHINGYHLRSYVQSKHKWTNTTWDRIDVDIFGRFHRRLPASAQVAQTKFMFDQWNTGKVRHRNAKVRDPKLSLCPCCKVTDETTIHVLRCRSNTDHTPALRQLRTTLSSLGPHPVFNIIKEKLCEWIDYCDDSASYATTSGEYPAKFNDSIREALQDQQDIGWGNAMKGYLSVGWRTMAEDDLFDSDIPIQGRGYQRMHTILLAIHTYHQTVWRGRNKMLHHSQDLDLRTIRDSEMTEIEDLYGKSDRLRAGDRHYCEQPLEVIQQKSPSSRRRWLLYMRRALTRASADGTRQTLMTNFFRSRTTIETATDTATRTRGVHTYDD